MSPDTTFDEWDLDDGRPSKADKFRPSLVARAKKRTVHPLGGMTWEVEGNSKLSDSRGSYLIGLDGDTGHYHCECYTSQYGDVRARKICSHVLAVILHREAHGDRGNGVGEEGEREPPRLSPAQDPLMLVEGSSPVALPVGVPEPQLGPSANLTGIPDVDDARFRSRPLPSWVEEIRPTQWEAVQQAVEEYRRGTQVVFLEAPTGSGKTLIADLVARETELQPQYMASTKQLQDQVLRDFSYADVLKGRANYPTQIGEWPEVTCDDCTRTAPDDDCDWCEDTDSCEYTVAREQFKYSELPVVNTSYFLHEANLTPHHVCGAPLVIADECDLLEGALMGFVEFRASEGLLSRIRVAPPKKGSHIKTLSAWLEEELVPALKDFRTGIKSRDLQGRRERRRLMRLERRAGKVAAELLEGDWVRDNKAGPMTLRPVKVASQARELLWAHGGRWLAMSATIISPDELADSLGLVDSPFQWATVSVPMSFPVENRPINYVPVGDMSFKQKELSWPKVAYAVGRLMDEYPDDRILVHTHTYDLANYIQAQVHSNRTLTYPNSAERVRVLDAYLKHEGSVLLAPSFDRGVDLPGDACRVTIVCKVPFPYLGDVQISTRMNSGREGQHWYTTQTLRSLVQMTGRGVRSATDTCESFILDAGFGNVLRRNKRLLPKWWVAAVNQSYPVKKLRRSG